MPDATFSIRLSLPRLVFSSGHFITYAGDVCERLHGHNYHVTAEVEGPLDENWYVVDFIAARDALQAIVDGLDHRMLLPTGHRTIGVWTTSAAADRVAEVVVTHGRRRWIFPLDDCVLLPVANTTSELLARYVAERFADELAGLTGRPPQRLRIAVDECDGQAGACELRWP